MKAYLDMVKNTLDNGVLTHNRTGIDTLATSGYMFVHNMKDGFPLLTTKKMGLKSICAELEMFIHGITDKKFLQDRNCKIWNEWTNPKKVPYANDLETLQKMRDCSDLGLIYGYQWTCFEPNSLNITTVAKKTKEAQPSITYPINPIVKVNADVTDPNIGLIFKTEYSDELQIISHDFTDTANHKYYTVQFLQTGSVKPNVRLDHIRRGKVKDSYKPLASHSGYRGDEKAIFDFINRYGNEIYIKMLKCWNHMMDRCYNIKCKQYKLYGEQGIFVDNDWHDFSIFLHDVSQLDNWPKLLRNPEVFDLDKDYYASNCYSKDTCIWLTHRDNIVNIDSKAFNAINLKTNETTLFISIHDCVEALGINRTSIQNCLNNKIKSSKGYKFEYLNDGKIYRYKQCCNQLKTAIETIKKDPTSRRLVVSAWNPLQLDEMALPPCHMIFELLVYPEQGTIDLMWFQRSSDLGLGVPYDIASYAMLLTLIAKETDYIPGKLIGFFGSCHIYVNQLDMLQEQLTREPLELPRLEITNWKSIWDWKYTDFNLIGYKSYDKLTAAVAV